MIFLLVHIFFFLTFPQLLNATLSWTTKTSMPTERYDMAVGMVGDIIYVIGGGPGFVPVSTVEAYDPLSNSWTSKADMPYPMHRLAAAVIGDIIYTCGGWYGMGAKPYTLEYDPGSDSWIQKADMPAARLYHAAASYGGKMYAFGGRYTYNTVFEYDPVGDSWTTKTPMPTGRYGHAAVTVNGKIYVIGGQDGTNIFSTVEEYDPIADSWTTKTPMPTPRAYLTACVMRDTIYAIGGSDNTKAYLNTVEKYVPSTNNWSSETSMPTARCAPVSSVVNEIIYVIGGDNGSALDTNEAAEPATAIELSSFYASGERGKIKLYWSTASESSIAYWIIERSIEDSYSIIAKIPGSGSSPASHQYTHTDEEVKPNRRYFYKLGAQSENGMTRWYGPVSAVAQINTSSKSILNISPNPFTTSTTISFTLPSAQVHKSTGAQAEDIELKIYDMNGRLVKNLSLVTGHCPLGTAVSWDGKDDDGKVLSSGVYLCILKTGKDKTTQKILLVR